jgi:hypothetical protein
MLLGATVGYRAAGAVGEDAFYAILGIGWLVLIIWTIVAYRRGESVFIWQSDNG